MVYGLIFVHYKKGSVTMADKISKADIMRNGIRDNPTLGNTELEAKLQADNSGMVFPARDIARYRTELKKAGDLGAKPQAVESRGGAVV